jgi:hypothetical protein
MVATYVASGTGVKFLRMSGGTDVDNLIQKKKKKTWTTISFWTKIWTEVSSAIQNEPRGQKLKKLNHMW